VLGNVCRSAAVLAAEGQSLEQSQQHQQHWRCPSDPRPTAPAAEARQHADQECCAAHQEQRHHERVLAADPVSQVSEDHRPERPDDKPDRERRQGAEQCRGARALGKEHIRERHGQAAEDVEVVPLDQRAGAGRRDHLSKVASALDLLHAISRRGPSAAAACSLMEINRRQERFAPVPRVRPLRTAAI
jgi:hypothetical protein